MTCLPGEIKKRTSELIAQNNLDKASTSTSDLQQEKKKETRLESSENFRKSCYICQRKKNHMTKYICIECTNYICLEHANHVCNICSSKKE